MAKRELCFEGVVCIIGFHFMTRSGSLLNFVRMQWYKLRPVALLPVSLALFSPPHYLRVIILAEIGNRDCDVS